MSLQSIYSFDHITNFDILALPRVVYNSEGTINTGGGRDNSGSLVNTGAFLNGTVFAIDEPHNNVTIGVWTVVEAISTSLHYCIGFGNPFGADSSNPHGLHTSLNFQFDGSIQIWRKSANVGSGSGTGVVVGATAPGVFTVGLPFYLEWNVIIGSLGSSIIRINEVDVFNRTGINIISGVDNTVRAFVLNAGNGRMRYDDLYILTAFNNGDGWTGFKGITKVTGVLVNGAGDITQWTPSNPTGINWQNIDEDTPNTTDFNDAILVGTTDLYQLQNVITDPSAVQLDLYLKKLDAGPCSVNHVLTTGGIDYVSTEFSALGPSYKYFRKVYTRVPNGNAWTLATFNTLQAGLRKAI